MCEQLGPASCACVAFGDHRDGQRPIDRNVRVVVSDR